MLLPVVVSGGPPATLLAGCPKEWGPRGAVIEGGGPKVEEVEEEGKVEAEAGENEEKASAAAAAAAPPPPPATGGPALNPAL